MGDTKRRSRRYLHVNLLSLSEPMRYACCGLIVESPQFDIPELLPSADICDADVRIELGTVPIPPTPLREEVAVQWCNSFEAIVVLDGVARILIQNGRRIVIDRLGAGTDREVRFALLSSCFATLMHQRGSLVLHASAASVGGRAVAFMAQSGTGKSTLAAAFAQHGHELITDDFLAIEFDPGEQPFVRPAFPYVKLYPEIVEHFAGAEGNAPMEQFAADEKLAWRSTAGLAKGHLPLQSIYLLSDADAHEEIVLLPKMEAFVELVRYSRALRILGMTGSRESHFRQIVRLLDGNLTVKLLRRRRSLAALPAVVRMVKADLAATVPEPSANP